MALQSHRTRLGPPLGDETQANAGFRGWVMPVLGSQPSSLETRQSLHQEGAGSGGLPSLAGAHGMKEGSGCALFSTLPPTSGNKRAAQPPPCNKQRGMHLISPVPCDYRRKKRLTGPLARDGGRGRALLGLCICPNKT